MRKLALMMIVACSGPSSAPPPPPAAGSASVSTADHIDHIAHGLLPPVAVLGEPIKLDIEAEMRRYHIHGLSIAVFEHGQVAWAKGFGEADADAHQPVTETTLFQAGSISKSVNALGVLEAVANGKLSLDTPINDSLTSWKLPDNDLTRATPVTLRRILSHTAGTTVHGFPGYAPGEPVPTIVQVLDGVPPANTAKIIVDHPPGKQFLYSGGGITIAQLALTEKLAQPYPQILATTVLGPLGMTNSTYEQPLPAARIPQAAAGYRNDGSAIPGKRNTYPEMAAAGLWTTPTDLARFFIELQRARAGTSTKISSAIAMEMTTPVMKLGDAGPDSIGLGVFLIERYGAKLFGHDGADNGFQAQAMASLDHGYGVIVMVNSDNGFRIFDEVLRAVFAEYGWGGDPPIQRVAIDPAKLPTLAGTYGTAAEPVAVVADHGKLWLHEPFGEREELVPVAGNAFVSLASGMRCKLDGASLERGPVKLPRIAEATHSPLVELEAGQYDGAVADYRALVAADPKALPEMQVNELAYGLMRDKPADALLLFRLVAAVFPQSMNAQESLAEGYEATGDKPRAIESYGAALARFDRDTKTPLAFRQLLRKTSQDALRRLK